MTENRWAITVDELVGSARFERGDQVEMQAEALSHSGVWSAALLPFADGVGGDVDGD